MTPSIAALLSLRAAASLLPAHLGVVVRGAIDRTRCARWAARVRNARAEWTHDFDGEQFSLGRAFYTHLETEQAELYFDDAAASDARVERHVPGLQAAMRALLAEATAARVVPRPGWCSAGVHVFPAGGALARDGGVIHFDTEGLTEEHVARRAPALSIVAMLQPADAGGGLRLWPVMYAGRDVVDDDEARSEDGVTILYEAGDVVIFDSYRLHQIQPFEGPNDRISATLHGAQIERAAWESWF